MDTEGGGGLDARVIRVRFAGDAAAGGRVPLWLLAGKLDALQDLLFHAAASAAHWTGGRRGPWANNFRDVVELTFLSAHRSQLVVAAGLPALPPIPPPVDVGGEAVRLVGRVLTSVMVSPGELVGVLPDRQDRAFFLRGVEALCPSPADEFELRLESPFLEQGPVSFSAVTRDRVRQARRDEALPEPGFEPRTIVGVLTKIHVDVAPLLIALQLPGGAEIQCYYDESLRDQVANLLAGSVVEVTGRASVDLEGRVKQLDSIADFTTVSLDPVRIARFELDGERFVLAEPLELTVEYTDGLWVYHNPQLNLWGSGERREDAVTDLYSSFAYLWRELAREEDSALDGEAMKVKRFLLALVRPDSGRG